MKTALHNVTLARLLTASLVVAAVFTGSPRLMAAEIPTKLKNASQIQQQLLTAGSVRVIAFVATNVDQRAVGAALSDRAARGQMIRNMNARISPVMLSLFPGSRGAKGRPVKAIDTLGAFAADVTPAELARMEMDPRILRIEIDEFRKTSLNQSLPLIGQTTAIADQPNGTDVNGLNPQTVAVIDTGVQAGHPFIGSARVVDEACFLSTSLCPNGTYDQVGPGASAPAVGESHGTHVAGIAMGSYASASTVNRGVASRANLLMVNVFGSQGGAYTSDIIQGLEHIYSRVITNNNYLRIASVNMSLGGSTLYAGDCDTAPEKAVIDRLRAAGVITTVAAGNDSSRLNMSSPGCISSAFSVAATSKSAVASSYTNISRTTDVFAPGGDFDADGCIRSSVINGYDAYCGTSMAAPHVAGAVALLRAAKPTATASEIEVALKTSGAVINDTRSSGTFSAPMINVANAIGILQGLQSYTLTTTVSGSGTVSSSPAGISCGTVCSATFVQNQTITLTAVPAATSTFTGWSGACSGTQLTCSVTMAAASSVEASFAAASWIVPLATALDGNFGWTSPLAGDAAAWYGQNQQLRSGDATGYATSGDIGDTQTSSMQATVQGPGTLSFFWSVSSEPGWDFLEFWVNGVRQSGSISGSVGWAQRSFTLASGTQTLRWTFRKDTSVSAGSDAGFVDRVTFVSGSTTPATYPLNITVSGGGTVSSSPAGINCGTVCSATFVQDQTITLTAVPAATSTFTGWSGACSGTQLTCSVTMSAASSVQANFATASWVVPLATALDGNFGWTSSLAGDAAAWYGQNQQLRSGDATGYATSGDIGDAQTSSMQATVQGPGTLSFFWSVSSEPSFDVLEFWVNGVRQSGSISGSVGWAQRSFTLASGTQTLRWMYRKDTSVSAGSDAGFVDRVTFVSGSTTPATYALQLTKSGTISFGTVTSTPLGLTCGTTCSSASASFAAGQSVVLTASPVTGRRFSRWSGACRGTAPTCTVVLRANTSVTATFR